jgi:hypothetical protein
MRYYIGAVVWTPVLGVGVVVFGAFLGLWSWWAGDLATVYGSGAIIGGGGGLMLLSPLASLLVLALAAWHRPAGWRCGSVVALVPILGPIGAWHWTLSGLFVPPPLEKRARRRKEELVTAPPGWLTEAQDTGPTPLPWRHDEAETIHERLPAVQALWELEPDLVETAEVPRPGGTLREGGRVDSR